MTGLRLRIDQVSRQMRHKTVSMTLDIYGHLYPESFDAVGDSLHEIFPHLSQMPLKN